MLPTPDSDATADLDLRFFEEPDDAAEVLAHLHDDVIPNAGFALTGTHHEIYLSDFRRVAPDKRRTILRQPVVPRA